MPRLALVALLAAMPPSISAQRIVPGSHPHSFHRPLIFFSDPFYSDAFYREGIPSPPPPPVIILQASSADSVPAAPPRPAEPLVIELRGDRYVRVSGEETSGAEMIDHDRASRRPGKPSDAATRPPAVQEMAPAILVFRDGHHEEVSDYTIADGVLYTRGDYYIDGSWNKKIQLSSLNLPETVQSNQSRGVRFQLPSSPNEVIIRP